MLNKSSRDGLIALSVFLFLTVVIKRSDLNFNFDPFSLIMSSQGATDGNICIVYYSHFKD